MAKRPRVPKTLKLREQPPGKTPTRADRIQQVKNTHHARLALINSELARGIGELRLRAGELRRAENARYREELAKVRNEREEAKAA